MPQIPSTAHPYPTRITQIDPYLSGLRDGVLAELGLDPGLAASVPIVAPPLPEHGDAGFPCFALCSALRAGPETIAADLAARLEARRSASGLVARVVAVGGFSSSRPPRRRSALRSRSWVSKPWMKCEPVTGVAGNRHSQTAGTLLHGFLPGR